MVNELLAYYPNILYSATHISFGNKSKNCQKIRHDYDAIIKTKFVTYDKDFKKKQYNIVSKFNYLV